MATIKKETSVGAPVEAVWAAFRDIGAVHTRLAPGFVVDCRMDGKDRIVTFANGVIVREIIVDIDDEARRLVYSVQSDRLTHHNASFQCSPEGKDRCRVVWIADLLPNEAAAGFGAMMEQGVAAMRSALERRN